MGWNLRNVVIFSVGLLVVLIGVGILSSGSYFVWLHCNLSDRGGFYSSNRKTRIRTSSHSVVLDPAKIDPDKWWPFQFPAWEKIRVRIRAGQQFFVGLAPTEEVRDYLSGVSYDRITYFSLYPLEVEYKNLSGSYVPARPGEQSFWKEKFSGSYDYDLKLEKREGSRSLVFMNRDGSSGIRFDLQLGLKGGSLLFAGIGLLVGGLLVLFVGWGIIVVSGKNKSET